MIDDSQLTEGWCANARYNDVEPERPVPTMNVT